MRALSLPINPPRRVPSSRRVVTAGAAILPDAAPVTLTGIGAFAGKSVDTSAIDRAVGRPGGEVVEFVRRAAPLRLTPPARGVLQKIKLLFKSLSHARKHGVRDCRCGRQKLSTRSQG